MNPDELSPNLPLVRLIETLQELGDLVVYRNGEPVAMLVAWDQWQEMRSAVITLSERMDARGGD